MIIRKALRLVDGLGPFGTAREHVDGIKPDFLEPGESIVFRDPGGQEGGLQAAKEFGNDDVKILHYKVTVTQNAQDYEQGRANGESLVHDFVNPHVTSSDADAVIISHSHNPNYGQGFYLATPQMDNASVNIATKISESSDFNYYPVTGNETYKSTSAVLVSKPIAQAGYPTFVYEIPEDIWEMTSTEKTKELFGLIAENINHS